MEERRNDIRQDKNQPNPLYDPYGQTSGEQGGGTRKAFRDSSPDEVREMMRERVAKGIAAFTGALEGFVQRTKDDELPRKTRDAIQGAGETTRSAIATTGEQIDRTRDTLKESHIGESAKGLTRDVTETTRDITRNFGKQTKEVGHTVAESTRDVKEGVGEAMKGIGDPTTDVAEGISTSGSSTSTPHTGERVDDVPDLNKSDLGTQRDLRRKER